MDQLKEISSRRRGDGFSSRELLREDREWAACWICRKKHLLRANNADHDYQDFKVRHPSENGCVVMRVGPEYLERRTRRSEAERRDRQLSIRDFLHNASVLQAFQGSATTLDLTGFTTASGLANSATAGWCSQYIDNHTNLYLDYFCQIIISVLTGSPANNQALYFYTAGSFVNTSPPANTAGTSMPNSNTTAATVTFLTIVSNPTGFSTIKVIPYQTSGDIPGPAPFSCGQAYNGFLPQYLWWPAINYTGQTVKPTSISVQGIYATVA